MEYLPYRAYEYTSASSESQGITVSRRQTSAKVQNALAFSFFSKSCSLDFDFRTRSRESLPHSEPDCKRCEHLAPGSSEASTRPFPHAETSTYLHHASNCGNNNLPERDAKEALERSTGARAASSRALPRRGWTKLQRACMTCNVEAEHEDGTQDPSKKSAEEAPVERSCRIAITGSVSASTKHKGRLQRRSYEASFYTSTLLD